MANWIDEALTAERRNDMIRAAARHGLAAQAATPRRSSRRLYFGAMAWLGRQLMFWGCRLQARYDVLVDASVVPAIRDRLAG